MSLEVRIDGVVYRARVAVSWRRSLDELAASATLSTGPILAGGAPTRIALGARLQLRYADELLFDGYVDSVDDDGDAESRRLEVASRGRPADLVDCSAPLGARLQQTVLDVARAYGTPFGLAARADVDVGAAFRRVVPTPGEKVYDVLERLARERGLLITSAADGTVVFTRAGADATPPVVLRRPGGVLRARWRFDMSERYSTYLCRAQRAGDEQTWGAALRVSGAIDDDLVPRHRPLIVTGVHGGPEAARQRLTWEAATRAGRSVVGTVVVRGVLSAAGVPWAPNQRVAVEDQVSGVQGLLLVVSVDASVGLDGGERTTLELGPVAGYELEVPTAARARGGVKVGAWTFQGGTPTLEDVR